MTRSRLLLLALAIPGLALLYMYSVAVRRPVIREAEFVMPDWPAGAAPLRVVLLSDIHVAGPDMPPERVDGIVRTVNAVRPDVVLIAGDFVSDKRVATRSYLAAAAVAPLGKIRSRMGVFAVLGNHDHWRGTAQVAAALREAGVRLLDNEAVSAGPLRIGGVDDDFTGHSNVRRTLKAMDSGPGARLLLSHSPDVAPLVASEVTLLLAGHTHCGQIRLPLVGALTHMSRYGDRFACGITRDGTLRVVTSAGLGTSILPLRLGTNPEIWVIRLRGH